MANPYKVLIRAVGLSGPDGWLSWTKLLSILIPIFCVKWHLDPIVALGAIAAAFGKSVFKDLVDRWSGTSTATFTETKTVTATKEAVAPAATPPAAPHVDPNS